MKSVLEHSHIEARTYFLKEESYFNFDLPKYFVFQKLLDNVSKKIEGKSLSDFYGSYIDPTTEKQIATYPCDFENVNYTILNNKDGKFAWRPIQLIHPAIYVSLVHKITEEGNWKIITDRFKEFDGNPKIKCYSLPIESNNDLSDKAATVSNWWHAIEQQSIELALNFEYVLHTDITDCYGSIYTHSVAWAIHTKAIAKDPKNRNKNSFVGNSIDKHIRDMSFGQTNGIPQGSLLMDFIAEIVLGYADLELSERIKQTEISDYKIIRYRDDYRIFSNNPQDAEHITKLITEIMIELGMRLNAQKTLVSNNVIRDSIKPDKLYWIAAKKGASSLQEHLILIHELSIKFPNCGSLNKALNKYFNRIKIIKVYKQNINVLISIVVDIAYKNPKIYPIASAILSKLLSLIDSDKLRKDTLDAIAIRFDKIPNTGHIKIWLQRITLKSERGKHYKDCLCEKVNDSSINIWNSDWLNDDLNNLISKESIIDEAAIDKLNLVIASDEVELFDTKTNYDNY
jgi:RNA-directed DNA polymerase